MTERKTVRLVVNVVVEYDPCAGVTAEGCAEDLDIRVDPGDQDFAVTEVCCLSAAVLPEEE